jgi:hypothetical protein
MAFQEKAGRSQEGSMVFLLDKVFSRRVATGPGVPDPFFNFTQEHFCRIWQPFIAAETGE